MRGVLAWGFFLVAVLQAQTVLFALWVPDSWRPDLTRILVLWVALTGLPRGGPIWAAVAGLGVDLASGTPLGFCAMLRLLLYGLARPFRGLFFDDSPLFLLPLAAMGALADLIGVQVLSRFVYAHPIPGWVGLGIAVRQAAVDMLLAPFVFVALELASGRRARAGTPA